MEKEYKKDTSADYDDMVGKKVEVSKPSTLLDFFDLDEEEDLRENWNDPYKQWNAAGMPPFNVTSERPFKQLLVSFRNEEDYRKFTELLDLHITFKTKSTWFPEREREENILNRWIEE